MARETLILIPTYNERQNLGGLVTTLLEVAPEADILIIDDASPDGTGELAEELSAAEARVHVLHRPAKLGMGTAYAQGYRWAAGRRYQRAAQLDADGSHDPRALPTLLTRLEEADLVIGSRAVAGGGVEGWGLHRRLLSGAGRWYCRALLGWDLRDPTSGFRALGERALEELAEGSLRSEGFSFQIEVAYRAYRRGLKIIEHPIVFVDRARGASKISTEIVAEALLMVPLLRLWGAISRSGGRRRSR